jgi:chromosomal replication initiation ATPase DnaA
MNENVIEIAENIKTAIGVNVFEQNRTQPVVDVRSMYCYLLRKDLNFTLYQVRDVFKSQGKNLDHSSVHHNVVLFENEVKNRRPELEQLRNELLGILSPKYKLLKLIGNIQEEEKLQELIQIIEQW